MDATEAYSLLFADSFMESIILPPHSAYILKVMLGFGGYNTLIMFLCASLGVIAGITVNWLVGWALITCRDKEWVLVETPKVDKCAAVFKTYLAWLLVLAWIPGLGAVLAVISGVSRVKIWILLFWASVGVFGFYGFMLLNS